MKRPSFSELTPAQQLHFGNGIGPSWLPDPIRLFITTYVSWFFKDASWRHHDFGYAIGRTEVERWECDYKFFSAMVKDALSQRPAIWIIAAPLALVISIVFYIAVMVGGWASFEYGPLYRSIPKALYDYAKRQPSDGENTAPRRSTPFSRRPGTRR